MERLDDSQSGLILVGLVFGLSLVIGSSALANDSEGMQPVADAGLPRYAAQEPVVLDGTNSYDPDNSGPLSYLWRQISGPTVAIVDPNTATPTICGSGRKDRDGNITPGGYFIQTDEIQECMFELVVSDDELTSLPDTVTVIIVPAFGASMFQQENPPFNPNEPTVIYFGGGDGITGGGSWVGVGWAEKANIISFPYYEPDPGGGPKTYYRCADMIIVYLSSVAPDYKQPIQAIGFSTGGDPAIDIGIHLNRVYRDARYAVNRLTELEGYYFMFADLFLTIAVDGEQCWIDGYNSEHENYPRDVLAVSLGLSHEGVMRWYRNSTTSNDMNKFNSGVVAGAYWSVVGPGKNLQLASTPDRLTYVFEWQGGTSSGYMDFYDEPNYPGRLPEPVTLVGPEDNSFVDANGVVLSCHVSENAIGYQLLFGSEPDRVTDYTVVSDTPEPPSEVITTFPFEQTFWTVRVYDEYGSTIYADSICIYAESVAP